MTKHEATIAAGTYEKAVAAEKAARKAYHEAARKLQAAEARVKAAAKEISR